MGFLESIGQLTVSFIIFYTLLGPFFKKKKKKRTLTIDDVYISYMAVAVASPSYTYELYTHAPIYPLSSKQLKG